MNLKGTSDDNRNRAAAARGRGKPPLCKCVTAVRCGARGFWVAAWRGTVDHTPTPLYGGQFHNSMGVKSFSLKPGRRGFTLIEMIGVLAVIVLLVAFMAPAVIRQMDEAARTRERMDLVAISNSIVLHVLNNRTIPHETNMALTVADWTQRPVSDITTNKRRINRAFLLDTNGWFGTTTGRLPYSQTVSGSAAMPQGARLMIVSSVGQALPVSTGRPGNAAFNDVWNTPEGGRPTVAPWATWTGRGEDLIIQRVNLDQLFYRLLVVNRDKFGSTPFITVGGTNLLAIASTNTGHDAWYTSGSIVGLCDIAGVPVMRLALTNSMGLVFEGGIWREKIGGGDSPEMIGQEFALLASKFMEAQWYPTAEQGGRTSTQQGAVTAMFQFLYVYSLWANPFPHFNRRGANAQQVPEYLLMNDLVSGSASSQSSDRLNKFTGAGGLLN